MWVSKCVTDTVGNTMLQSQLSNGVSGVPRVLDLINDRPGKKTLQTTEDPDILTPVLKTYRMIDT